MKSSLVAKRSVVIDGQKSSVSLEEGFWISLKDIAHERRETLQHLITSINADRQSCNLSSVLRVFILKFYKDELARQRAMFEQREISVPKRRQSSSRIRRDRRARSLLRE
jgi:predicted DNA-binding ribbon-helix-helix protein